MKTRSRNLWFVALFAVGLLLAVAGWGISVQPATDPTPTPSPTPTRWPLDVQLNSPGYGVNINIWWDEWAAKGSEGREGIWQRVEEAGFTWVKQHLAWRDVEGIEKGHYDWWTPDRVVAEAEATGVNLVFRIDRPPIWTFADKMHIEGVNGPPYDVQDFGDFCYALAERYAGRVRGYQVWNEPNLAREWWGYVPDPVRYVELLQACYTGIKTADPDALVISAALSPTGSGPPDAMPDADYLIAMYEAGAGSYFDLLGANAPGYKAPPEVSPEEAADPDKGYGGHRVFCFRHVEDLRAIMERYGDVQKQVAIMEFGWTTDTNPDHQEYVWFAVTPETQADYLVRAFNYAQVNWSPWIGPMFVWNIPDPQWTPENEEFWWGITDPFHWEEGDVRPAYNAIVEMDKP
ncbi:MAG: hypothetical protein JW981_00180 [Anaerolineae bacterium]|nr:hypothetical protein [Anaerolineae bacterium]